MEVAACFLHLRKWFFLDLILKSLWVPAEDSVFSRLMFWWEMRWQRGMPKKIAWDVSPVYPGGYQTMRNLEREREREREVETISCWLLWILSSYCGYLPLFFSFLWEEFSNITVFKNCLRFWLCPRWLCAKQTWTWKGSLIHANAAVPLVPNPAVLFS